MEKFKKISLALLRTTLEFLVTIIGGVGVILLAGLLSMGFGKLLDMIPNAILGGVIILIFAIVLIMIFIDRVITNYERNK